MNITKNPFLPRRTPFGAAVTATARSYLGVHYRWGGKTPMGIDCSGLTSMSYLLSGVVIYRDAEIREGFPVHPIPRSSMRPGDLLYFPGTRPCIWGGQVYPLHRPLRQRRRGDQQPPPGGPGLPGGSGQGHDRRGRIF